MEINEKYFKNDNPDGASTIDQVLSEGETVLWRGKPDRKAYICSAVLKLMPIALVWLAIDAGMLTAIFSMDQIPKTFFYFLIPFFLVHLAPVWFWIANIVKAKIELKNIEYAITERRIIVRKGAIGVDFKYLLFSEIVSVNVKVGIIDKLCKVGDIYITANGQSAVLFDQRDAAVLGAKIQKVVNDIKTDMNYPNAFRPENNPGYQTRYSGQN